MFFPKLTAPPQQRVTADRFLGLDRRAGSAMGGMQDMENLWAGAIRRWRQGPHGASSRR